MCIGPLEQMLSIGLLERILCVLNSYIERIYTVLEVCVCVCVCVNSVH